MNRLLVLVVFLIWPSMTFAKQSDQKKERREGIVKHTQPISQIKRSLVLPQRQSEIHFGIMVDWMFDDYSGKNYFDKLGFEDDFGALLPRYSYGINDRVQFSLFVCLPSVEVLIVNNTKVNNNKTELNGFSLSAEAGIYSFDISYDFALYLYSGFNAKAPLNERFWLGGKAYVIPGIKQPTLYFRYCADVGFQLTPKISNVNTVDMIQAVITDGDDYEYLPDRNQLTMIEEYDFIRPRFSSLFKLSVSHHFEIDFYGIAIMYGEKRKLKVGSDFHFFW